MTQDTRAAVAAALEQLVNDSEWVAGMNGQWARYDVAYAAHAAWLMGDNPITAAWDTVHVARPGTPVDVITSARATATAVEAAVTTALAIK